MTENNCCCRTKERSEKEFRDLMNRLKRIEGQVKGVQRMLEEKHAHAEIKANRKPVDWSS